MDNLRLFFAVSFFTMLCFVDTSAQQGSPYISHFPTPSGVSNQNWGFVQGESGLMNILNRKGIYSFDGLQWENIAVIGRPISIAFSNYLFYCSDKGVGYYQRKSDGTLEQHLLIPTIDDNYFYKFSKIDEGLLVVSPQTICKINTFGSVSVDTLYHENRNEVFISDFFQINSQMYHVKNNALIYLTKLDGGYEMLAASPMNEEFTFSFIHNNQAFFGSTAGRLYRFNGTKLEPFILKDQNYLNASRLQGGISVDNKTIALSTLNGGCLIINSDNGETKNILNYFNGLPDDEVFSLGTDSDGGLWISHGMGISRADLSLPISAFGYYQGLKGNLLSCVDFNGKFYVGSSEGLFVLEEQRKYRTHDVIVPRAASRHRTESEVEQKTESNNQPQTESVETKRRGFISRLFRRSEPEIDVVAKPIDSDQHQRGEVKDLPPQRRRIYELQSISHSYQQIEGLNGKVRRLLNVGGTLYAATNFGLFEINASRANLIVREKNITFAEESALQSGKILLGTDNGAYIAHKVSGQWAVTTLLETNNLITSVLQVDDKNFLVTDEFDLFIATQSVNNKFDVSKIAYPFKEHTSLFARNVNGLPLVFCSTNVYKYNLTSREIEPYAGIVFDDKSSFHFNQQNFSWVKKGRDWTVLAANKDTEEIDTKYFNLFDNPTHIYVSDSFGVYVINDFSNIYRMKFDDSKEHTSPLSVFIKQVYDKNGNILDPYNIDLTYSNNSLRIRLSAPSYLKEGSILFQYKIDGLSSDWSEWTSDPNLYFPYFPAGSYTITIRAKDILETSSESLVVSFHVKSPFWKTLWFYSICAILVLILFAFIVKYREHTLRKEKLILEERVKQRTKTIEEQKEELQQQNEALAQYNEEILAQKEEIEAQRDKIEIQRDQIFKQNDDITQSITYARKIQTAVMPAKDIVNSLLKDSFIMFRPRDIVSGDFYWMTEHNNRIVIVAADCTGHGVPGAFMSMMGVSFLNEIVNVDGQTQPDIILNNLRQKIIATLYQIGKDGETRDGMDASVCVLLKNTRTLMYAGAYNPLYIFRKGELIEYKADKMPVGVHPKEKEPFTLHNILLEPNDNIYIFSDGFVSQFGGPKGRKFMAKPFKELLLSIQDQPISKQLAILEDTMDKWQAAYDQVDDILVIGFSV